jgi:L-threonylcarbamoyladenylate synthase
MTNTADAAASSPGLLRRHYAPATPLILYPPGTLKAIEQKADEGFLFLGKTLQETAAHLFGKMRELDGAGLRVIHAELAPETGLGRAVNDRLRRAAARAGTQGGA